MNAKFANSVVDYAVDWDLSEGEVITASEWTAYPEEDSGIAIVAASGQIGENSTSCLISGGVSGHIYELSNRVLTSTGRAEVYAITIRIYPFDFEALPVPPSGFLFLTDLDGAYLTDGDGAFLVEPASW